MIRRFASHSGSALISTMLVIAVLTIIVVAFLQSMTVEQKTARSYMNRYRADLAAQAAQNDAATLLATNLRDYPDSTTWWDEDLASTGNGGTVLSYYATEAATDATKASTANSFYLPLVSGAKAVSGTSKGGSLSLIGDEPDLNSTTDSTFLENGEPWIGNVPGETPQTVRVPWVYINDSKDKPIARYAFWVEDDSFRVNVNTAGAIPRKDDTFGKSASEVPIQGAMVGAKMDDNRATALANGIVNLREELGSHSPDKKLFTPSEINYASSPPDKTNYEAARFLITSTSSALNLSRLGARRVNLNELVTTTSNASDIADQMAKIIAAIDYRPASDTTTEQFAFGERFYRTTDTVTSAASPVSNAEHREIYLNKIAANIRDYIDTDSSATNILDDGSVSVTKPSKPVGDSVVSYVSSTNDFWAVGQENVPRLTKTMVHVAQTPTQMSKDTDTLNSTLSYYFEFWNMGTKDIVVGGTSNETQTALDPSTFIQVGNQPGWIDTAPIGGRVIVSPDRPRKIPLTAFQNLRFKAGSLTVLTTDPLYSAAAGWLTIPTTHEDGTPSIYYAAGYSEALTGPIAARTNSSDGYGGNRTIDCDLRPVRQPYPSSSTVQWDNQTYVFLADNHSILDSQRAAVPIKPGIFIDTYGVKNNTTQMHYRGGSLPGNFATGYDLGSVSTPYHLGDPRASTDPLAFDAISTKPAARALPATSAAFPSWRDESSQSANSYYRYSVLGYMRPPAGKRNVIATAPGLNPYASDKKLRWDDASSDFDRPSAPGSSSPGSVAVVADAPLKSIGELGNIYDPAFFAPSAGSINVSRGGGRTLRIGQSEQARYETASDDRSAQWDGRPDSVSRSRVAWRLCDIFSAGGTSDDPLQQEGLINPNGVDRDGGAALRAALYGFKFNGADRAQGDSAIDQKTLSEEGKAITDSLHDYIKANGPLRERGELSELSIFNTGSKLAGVDMSTVSGAGREQLFRRLIELTTTKGNTFTVYIVGQALQPPVGTVTQPKVLATVKRKVTLRLVPKFTDSKLADDEAPEFDPENPATRFATPTRYDVQVLNVSQ